MQELNSFVPMIPMRGVVVLPGEDITFDVGRPVSIKAVQAAGEEVVKTGEVAYVLLVCQKDPTRRTVSEDDIYRVGTYCQIIDVKKIRDTENLRVRVQAKERAVIQELSYEDDFFMSRVQLHEDEDLEESIGDSFKMLLAEHVRAIAPPNMQSELLRMSVSLNYKEYVDAISALLIKKFETKQRVLEELDLIKRYEVVCGHFINERKLAELDSKIDSMVKSSIDKNQREYYLREKISVIKKELGDDTEKEIEEFRSKAESKPMPDHVKERLNQEINRFASLPAGSHEAPTTRGLIECILDLPWSERTDDNVDIAHARKVLDRDHFGLEKVKDRIIEYLSVAKRTNSLSGQIICLVGPPGVGKTSIVSSIAEAVGRKFVRMSLGGIDDEAEIRGHRRTYIGAMPGRIITAMRQAKTVNPVLLFDEIDKLNKNIHGDPAAAMLEVLDSAQNSTFRDHYLEIPYDLSQVMFITTANSLDTIPRPLLDRMEVIEVPGYLDYEKVQIAARHLIPKQLQKHGLNRSEFTISEDAIEQIVTGYTRESGVRTLDRVLAKVCRKASCELHEGKARIKMTSARIVSYLGAPKHTREMADKEPQVGLVNGLAWTSVGGEIMPIEVIAIPGGKGALELTGSLGDVIKESMKAAYTVVRANAHKFGVDESFFNKHDIHIHLPEGAVPKDGPSAGIGLVTAIMSAVSGVPVAAQIAMTGEITLRGNVLAIGGLREKLLAAIRAGVKTAFVPLENKSNVEELEDEIKKNIRIVFISNADEVLKKALLMPTEVVVPQLTACGVPSK